MLGIARFASADTIVPNPANPQSYNRYSYVRNNPLNFVDPTGHVECGLLPAGECENTQSAKSGDEATPSPIISSPSPPSKGESLPDDGYLFNDLPVDTDEGQGFGATNFANANATGLYAGTSGLHGGIDLFAPYNTNVYSLTWGVIIEINHPEDVSADAQPNIVIKVVTPDGKTYYITYGHVVNSQNLAEDDVVHPGQLIGTLEDQRESNADGEFLYDNSHLHLVIGAPNGRVYNPLSFFDPAIIADINWNSYAEGENLFSISSFVYSTTNFWTADDTSPIRLRR